MSEKRKDNKGRILKTGESQRKDLIYQYRYTDFRGKRQSVYASTLQELRQKEKEIQKQIDDGIDYEAGQITVIELLEKYKKLHPDSPLPHITPHVCRHTYCSNMAKVGMNPKTLQYLMGHSDIGVTMNTYTYLGLEDAKDEMIRMEELNAAKKELEKSTGEKPVTQKMFRVA